MENFPWISPQVQPGICICIAGIMVLAADWFGAITALGIEAIDGFC